MSDNKKTEKNIEEDIDEDKKEELAEKILEKEENSYHSKTFLKIENEVKDSLKNQKTDDALRDITLGALFLGSSDVHYECYENEIIVRLRIDGILVDIFELSKIEYKYVLERLKYASHLKLNITNIPQDGKYEIKLEHKKIDVRVSTLPTKYGENIVSRILDASKAIIDFEELGFFWTSKRMIEKAIKKRNGMILVTGPTGSGKTTTLYTTVSKLNTRDKKIITLEDPIEYELPGIIQSEVNEKNGFTYEMGLKALLRQDPDIIMVGEIRDYETLNIATSASLTGHLVLSTLHTKSAAETLDRIINMGLPPYILASALDIIIAQRLIRKICSDCKHEKVKTPEELALVKAMMKDIGMGELLINSIKLYEGVGCEKCNHSGYKGRMGIYEIITFSNKLRDLIRSGATVEKIINEARKGDLITMKEDGILKAIKGHTTITEILRVI
ncbi:MAG: GspE/PulE family protein [Candidatus Gracilibacteria bacterium]|nr:GspE/PulE family protein [Candidatus Gracilibacteria bacterium]